MVRGAVEVFDYGPPASRSLLPREALKSPPLYPCSELQKTLERIKIEVRWTPAGVFYSAESDGQADAMVPIILGNRCDWSRFWGEPELFDRDIAGGRLHPCFTQRQFLDDAFTGNLDLLRMGRKSVVQ